jgi:hypothetical protein
VVSKPAAKNTTSWSGLDRATANTSSGDETGLTLPPAARACSSERGSAFGALQGTRSMSPKAATTTPLRASWMAAYMSSSGHTQTGQPGPGMSSICRGKAPRNPAWLMERSWPPHTFITRTRSGNRRPRMRSSQPRASVTRSTAQV